MNGTLIFEGGASIPKGKLLIYLDDPLITDSTKIQASATVIESDGGTKEIAFSLPPVTAPASTALQVVARLERPDGWLIARGSVKPDAGTPLRITLHTVMY